MHLATMEKANAGLTHHIQEVMRNGRSTEYMTLQVTHGNGRRKPGDMAILFFGAAVSIIMAATITQSHIVATITLLVTTMI